MQVLVAYASKHGSTAEIAQAIADELQTAHLEADVQHVADIDRLAAYDAVVLGSAVYVGRWLPEAVAFVEAHGATLADRPVWFFSSGPIGEPEPMPRGDPEGITEMSKKVGVREHRVLAGRIDRADLSLGEKMIVRVVRAPEGDFRDWPAVGAYAHQIAAELGALQQT